VALPLTHVTDGYSFRNIMAIGTLEPAPCRVFGESLVYLFYGRPAYRSAAELESNGLEAYWPICFVLEPDCVPPKRIFPFDSGAFHHKRFMGFMHHDMIKEDFALDPDPSMPGRLLRLFWTNERSYYDAEDVSSFKPATLDFEAKSYAELIRSPVRAPFDERNSAIELQVDTAIPLKGNTLAVILPHALATADMLARIEALDALALPFGTVRRQSPVEMVGQIYTIVRDLLSGEYAEGRGKCW